MYCCFDNEEVGSGTKQGALSTFLSDVLHRISDGWDLMRKTGTDSSRQTNPLERTNKLERANLSAQERYYQAVAASFLVSCDNAHAAVSYTHLDFRPVFERVEELVRDHVFENLRGMLYFTDGYGVYPKKMPPFETAFIFLEEDYQDREVPPWAIRLVLREEELLPLERGNTE